jgi:oligopeptide/dipeptide ABC transporter ATP-binding protein
MNALNPVLRLREQVGDALDAHRPDLSPAQKAARVDELFNLVGISTDRGAAYPHELSGGMRQRAMIATAMVLEPEIIIMDEPTTALDVVMQRQILGRIMALRKEFGFAVIFITHDLSLLLEVADTIAVMYAGRIVELAAAAELYRTPRHPYSTGLLQSFPLLRGPRQTLSGIPGSPPDLRSQPPGCSFQPRCRNAVEACTKVVPLLAPTRVATDGPDRQVACLLYDESVQADLVTSSGPESTHVNG